MTKNRKVKSKPEICGTPHVFPKVDPCVCTFRFPDTDIEADVEVRLDTAPFTNTFQARMILFSSAAVSDAILVYDLLIGGRRNLATSVPGSFLDGAPLLFDVGRKGEHATLVVRNVSKKTIGFRGALSGWLYQDETARE